MVCFIMFNLYMLYYNIRLSLGIFQNLILISCPEPVFEDHFMHIIGLPVGVQAVGVPNKKLYCETKKTILLSSYCKAAPAAGE